MLFGIGKGLQDMMVSRKSGRAARPGLRVLVVLSYYNAWEPDQLVRLLDQLSDTPSGYPFETRIVVNQAQPHRLDLPERHAATEVLYRENTAYNLGAWDAGWRAKPVYDVYLFLQEECRILRADWLLPFLERLQRPGTGLVGESIAWNVRWRFYQDYCVRTPHLWSTLSDGRRVDIATFFLDYMQRHGIPHGPKADHLQSLVLGATRKVLEAVDGFNLGGNWDEAVACEIAFSKKVQALGLKISQVGLLPFTFIAHPQWSEPDRDKWSLLKTLRKSVRVYLRRHALVNETIEHFMIKSGKHG